MQLEERTIGSLHDFLLEGVLSRYVRRGQRGVDLGAGSGALAVRIRALGLDVLAVDENTEIFKANVPFRKLDLNQSDFSRELGENAFDLVTFVEVVEHVESPIGFLRNVGQLLRPQGIAMITTPNVDNAPARVKFLLKGKVRMLNEIGDPTHISPIFLDLLRWQLLPRAGLKLIDHQLYPARGFKVTRRRYAWAFRLLAGLLPGDALMGDNHILVLQSRS
jgi:2-polyprenyl-3-methyl-5-hydroxy-6-metoxy-1,4-benzoquinol methylase